MSRVTDVSAFIAGFVAAEGSFIESAAGTRFRFSVGLGAEGRGTCQLLQRWLGVGSVTTSARRQAHYDDEVTYVVQSMAVLVDVIVPFMDEHLPPSYKREQYLAWRERLMNYWEHRAKRRRPCTADACELPQRAKGLCRGHYYLAYGH